MKPLISIIIPSYNRAYLIAETLNSILLQSYDNWECIVVDDGSTDNTQEVLAEYIKKDNRFQYYKRPKERLKGPNSCRNYGFELSKGDYIKWFDSDDFMYPDLLEKQLDAIKNNFHCNVCKVAYYDFENNIVLKHSEIFSNHIIEDYLIGNLTFYVSGPIWRRSFLDKQEILFDTKISNLDDWDFNLRMLYNYPKINFLDEVLIKYRVHNNSLSQEIGKLNFREIQSEFKARRKHLLHLIFMKNVNTKAFKQFIIARNKYFLREALILKNNCDFFLFKNLILTQVLAIDIKGIIKSFVGYIGLKFFKKGYKFFK
ncbi:glycosyltransferase [Flavobacterium sp. 17A]|uniref:Glycosyltransferase n=1 Tax=Flavobacterium potami TaxID=2872310 RepID=A0A9X1KRH5_9FLAO|nr:glycosyltransferase family 2 protein [Flavobacterium potami]MBZ4036565.1 glycosyltransferase [Flavobacterium potami]